jgi:chemotaxis protein MotB
MRTTTTTTTTITIALWMMATASGCVKKSTHEAALADAEKRLKASEDEAQKRLAAAEALRRATEGELEACKKASADLDAKLGDTSKKLDAANALTQRLNGDLEKCGKKMKDETGALSAALAETKAALEEARKAKAAAEARAQLFKQLTLKFQKMIDAGSLKIVLRNGRMVLQLATDVLFDSGKTDLKPAGQQALRDVAAVLRTLGGRQLQVAGHTDNVAIQTARFPSNWELSTARAVTVVRFLIAEGLEGKVLSAAGYGEFDPLVSNDTPDGRAKNRRIEITLQPDISELVALPDVK